MTTELEFDEIDRLTMIPDRSYDDPDKTTLIPMWEGGGEKESFKITLIELDPAHFPPGTRVVIETPICPKCGWASDYDPLSQKVICAPNCIFDWITWGQENYG